MQLLTSPEQLFLGFCCPLGNSERGQLRRIAGTFVDDLSRVRVDVIISPRANDSHK